MTTFLLILHSKSASKRVARTQPDPIPQRIMKKTSLFILTILAGFVMTLSSCSGDSKDKKSDTKAKAQTAASALPNYRYVDIDTVLAKYNLSKDYTEEMMRMQGNLESEAQRHENAIKSFASSMQSKYQNNQYNEQSFNADQSRMQQMQTNAQSAIEKLQNSNAKAAMDAEKVIQDSIKNFIELYNAKHHYDAILYKAATLYINPALDITDDVGEGLNARYNKVKK